jgi:GH25 family lysozyme M1 (1,4-beta-N-acetylmuramidase)
VSIRTISSNPVARAFLRFILFVVACWTLWTIGVGLVRSAPTGLDATTVSLVQQTTRERTTVSYAGRVANQAALLAASATGATKSVAMNAATAAQNRARGASAQLVVAQHDSDAALVSAKSRAAASPYFAWFGILAVAVLWLISFLFAGDWNPLALAMGLDNRLSTSKLQALFWTAAVGFVYAMLYADRLVTYHVADAIHVVPANVLIALGMSATSVVAAKAITSSQVAANPQAKGANDSPSYDLGALVTDDGAATASLTKVQFLFWTVVAIAVYIITSMQKAATIAGCSPVDIDNNITSCGLPDIDTMLMAFMGLGHATYLGVKLAHNPSPMLTSVMSSVTVDGRNQITLSGANLGSSGSLLMGGALVEPSDLSWMSGSVTFDLPSKPDGGQWAAGDSTSFSINVGGVASPPINFQYSIPSTPASGRALPQPLQAPLTIRRAPTTPAPTITPRVTLKGVDVSYAQGIVDWDSVAANKLTSFVYSRACYGSNPADDDGSIFRRNHDECKRLGIPFGAYHFFLFSQGGTDQANHFLEQINGRYGELRAMVDIEEMSGFGQSQADMISNLGSFTQIVEAAVGAKMLIYTNADTWNTRLGGTNAFAGHQLWVCNFTFDPTVQPAMPNGFSDWTIFQYADNGSIPVLDGPTTRAVDLDILKGGISTIMRSTR